jgi:hypothetical protein
MSSGFLKVSNKKKNIDPYESVYWEYFKDALIEYDRLTDKQQRFIDDTTLMIKHLDETIVLLSEFDDAESDETTLQRITVDWVLSKKNFLKEVDDHITNELENLELLTTEGTIDILKKIYMINERVNELEMLARYYRSQHKASEMIPGTKFNIPKLKGDMNRGRNGEQCPRRLNPKAPKLWDEDYRYFREGKKRGNIFSELHCVENCGTTREAFAEQLNWYLGSGDKKFEVLPQIQRCIQMRQKDIDDYAARGSKDRGQHAHEIKRMINLRNDIIAIGLENIGRIVWNNDESNFGIVRNPQAGGKRRSTRKANRKQRKQTHRNRSH